MYRPVSGSAPNVNSWLDVQSAIRGLTQDFATAFNTGNYDQAAAMFTSDGYLMPPQSEAAQGAKPIELMLRKIAERRLREPSHGDAPGRGVRRHGR